jgi:hypothetical protein
MISRNLLRISVLLAIVGIALQIGIGTQGDSVLAPALTYLNLYGFVALFLAGLYYRLVPQAALTRLAKLQAWLAALGAIIFPIGTAGAALGYADRFQPAATTGASLVLAGMLVLAIVVFRHSRARAD